MEVHQRRKSKQPFLLWDMVVNKPTHYEELFPGSVGCCNLYPLSSGCSHNSSHATCKQRIWRSLSNEHGG